MKSNIPAKSVLVLAAFLFSILFSFGGMNPGALIAEDSPEPSVPGRIPPEANLFAEFRESFAPPALAGFGVNTIDPLSDYASWPSSGAPKEDDILFRILDLFAKDYGSHYKTSTQTDINGDGLVDLLVHFSPNAPKYFGIFLNRGDLGFELTYKCVYTYYSSDPEYYGDCADTGSQQNVPFPHFFYEQYLSWPTSNAPRENETIPQTLDILYPGYSRATYSTMADFNGDGLSDIAYHDTFYVSGTLHKMYAIFLNQGDLRFDDTYKCVYSSVSLDHTYYGDCADTQSSQNLPLENPFYPYFDWPNSAVLKTGDTTAQVLYRTYLGNDSYSGRSWSSVSDFNGDGLSDILKHFYSSPHRYELGVFLNRGDLSFDPVYRCVYADPDGYGPETVWRYYGNCADAS